MASGKGVRDWMTKLNLPSGALSQFNEPDLLDDLLDHWTRYCLKALIVCCDQLMSVHTSKRGFTCYQEPTSAWMKCGGCSVRDTRSIPCVHPACCMFLPAAAPLVLVVGSADTHTAMCLVSHVQHAAPTTCRSARCWSGGCRCVRRVSALAAVGACFHSRPTCFHVCSPPACSPALVWGAGHCSRPPVHTQKHTTRFPAPASDSESCALWLRVLLLQGIAAAYSVRVTFISGDVHVGAFGCFQAHPKQHIRVIDPKYMLQVRMQHMMHALGCHGAMSASRQAALMRQSCSLW